MKAIAYAQQALSIEDLNNPRVLRPAPLAIKPDGYLYFTANQRKRQAGFHDGKYLRGKPYSLLRVEVCAAPAPTH